MDFWQNSKWWFQTFEILRVDASTKKWMGFPRMSLGSKAINQKHQKF